MAQSNSDTLIIPVSGMTCAACVHHVGEAIRTVPGVANVSINLATARATVSLDGVAVTDPPLDELARAVADAGYRLDTHATNSDADTGRSDEERDLLRRMLVAMAGSVLLLLGGFPALPWTDGLFAAGGWWYPLLLWAVATPVQLWAAGRSTWPDSPASDGCSPTMHTLIALGTSVAYGYSVVGILLMWIPAFAGMTGTGGHHLHFDMAAIIVALILLGRWLEARALSRASDAIGRLMDLRPQVAHLMSDDGSIRDVTVDQVAVGDTLAVRPGEQIPRGRRGRQRQHRGGRIGADGREHAGREISRRLGAHRRAERHRRFHHAGDASRRGYDAGPGDPPGRRSPGFRRPGATAGRPCLGMVRAGGRTDRAGGGSGLAVRGPAPALSGDAWQYAMLTLVAVFIIACPCALGLATPTAIIVGVGKAAERGILIRSAAVLETAHRVRMVAVDKTGTLTVGRPLVTDVIAGDGMDQATVMAISASAEQLSEHPIGRAVVERARDEGLTLTTPTDFVAHRGAGVTARVDGQDVVVGNASLMVDQAVAMDAGLSNAAGKLATEGKTPMLVARDGRMEGVIAVADGIKPRLSRGGGPLCKPRACA